MWYCETIGIPQPSPAKKKAGLDLFFLADPKMIAMLFLLNQIVVLKQLQQHSQ